MSRAERRHHRERIKARHLRDWLATWGGTSANVPKDIASRHPLDCGRPRCGCCHFEKLRSRTPQRQRVKRALRREAA